MRAPQSYEARVCGSGVAAYTTIGGRVTFLCRRFARLESQRAEVVIIHEALHAAGLGEWPSQPDALRPEEINRLVERSCALRPGMRR